MKDFKLKKFGIKISGDITKKDSSEKIIIL